MPDSCSDTTQIFIFHTITFHSLSQNFPAMRLTFNTIHYLANTLYFSRWYTINFLFGLDLNTKCSYSHSISTCFHFFLFDFFIFFFYLAVFVSECDAQISCLASWRVPSFFWYTFGFVFINPANRAPTPTDRFEFPPAFLAPHHLMSTWIPLSLRPGNVNQYEKLKITSNIREVVGMISGISADIFRPFTY